MKKSYSAVVAAGLMLTSLSFVACGEDAFIRATGTQYVDTGYKPGPNTKIVADFAFVDQSTGQQRIFGLASDPTICFNLNGGCVFAWSWKDGDGNWTATGLAGDMARHVILMDAKTSHVELQTGGTVTYSTNATEIVHTKTAAYPLTLFAYNNKGTAQDFACAKIYSLKIYEYENDGETLTPKLDLVPCLKGGEPGFKDSLTDAFYRNQGKGAFLYGGEIASVPDDGADDVTLTAADGEIVTNTTALAVGTPKVEKTGAGEVWQTKGAANFGGKLYVTEGKLRALRPDSFGEATSVVVTAGTTLEYGRGAPSCFANIEGAGTITLSGMSASTLPLNSTSRIGRTDSELACYWGFEDEAEPGKDMSATGSVPLEVRTLGDKPPAIVRDGAGVSGRYLRLSESLKKGSMLYSAANSAMPSGTGAFTFSVWLRMTTSTKGTCYVIRRAPPLKASTTYAWEANGWGTTNFWYLVLYNSGKTLGFSTHGWTSSMGDANKKAVFASSTDLRDNKWHHLVGTYANKVLSFYYDGELKQATTLAGELNIKSSLDLELGSYTFAQNDTYSFNGDMDEIQYCNGCWSAETVRAEYLAKRPPTVPVDMPPVAFGGLWRLYAANAAFGTPELPAQVNPASSLEVANGGYFSFFGDQRVTSLYGIGVDGGVNVAADKTLTVTGDADAAFAGRLTGAGSFVKEGTGKLEMTGASTLGGTLTVRAGTLSVAGPCTYGRTNSELRGYWNFEDASNVGADATGGGNDLMVDAVGTPTVALVEDGVVGKGFRLSQKSDSPVDTLFLQSEPEGTRDQLPHGQQPFTISFWVRPRTYGGTSYFMRHSSLVGTADKDFSNTGWDNGWIFSTAGSKTKWQFGPLSGGWVNPGVNQKAARIESLALDDGQWHHVVGTRSERIWKLYVDGELKATYEHDSVTSISQNDVFQLGSYTCKSQPQNTVEGDFDEVQYCIGAWTDEEIAAEYAAKRPPERVEYAAVPEPVAHWDFDEESVVDGVRCFKDSGPLALHLQNVNSGSNWMEVKPHADGTGAAVWAHYSGPHLSLLSSVTNAAKTKLLRGDTNPNFTVSVRFAYCGGEDNGRKPFLCVGDAKGAPGCLRLSHEGVRDANDAQDTKLGFALHVMPGEPKGKTLTDSLCVPTPSEKPYWSTITVVNDAKAKKAYVYRDGTLVETMATTYELVLRRIDVGYNTYGTNYAFLMDDLQIFDSKLTGAQVKALVRGVASPALPKTASISVADGATFETAKGVTRVSAVTGAGSVVIDQGAGFAADDLSGFSGTITGAGCLYVTDGHYPAQAQTVGVRIDDGLLAVSAANPQTALVQTSGAFFLPTKGKVKLSDSSNPYDFVGQRFLIAKCAAYDGPATTEGWSFEPAAGADDKPLKGKFKHVGDQLWLMMSGGGSVLLVR